MLKTAVVIPMRCGSVRINNKNILPILGKRLFEYTLDSVVEFDPEMRQEIIISTDSDEYWKLVNDYAKSIGLKLIYHKRKPEHALNSSKDIEFFQDLLSITDCELFYHARVTTPIRDLDTIWHGFVVINTSDAWTSIRSVYEIDTPLEKMGMWIDGTFCFMGKAEQENCPTQELDQTKRMYSALCYHRGKDHRH